MAEISDLVIIDDNNTARWPEGMAFAQVNNSARADEGILARWYRDTNGSLTTGGILTAYTLTPNRTIAALTAGLRFSVQFNLACGAAPTLNVAGLGAKNLTREGAIAINAGDLQTGRPYDIFYDGTQFQVLQFGTVAPQLFAAAGSAPIAARRTENDTTLRKVLSIQSGSGAGNDFSINETGDGSNNVATVTEQIGATVTRTFGAASQGFPIPLDLTEIATPAAPGAGKIRFYAKTGNGQLAFREGASGVETFISPLALPSIQGLVIANNSGTPNSKIDVTIAQALITNFGILATGQVAFTTNPVATNTLTLNGTAITFVASGATGNQVNIGANLAATLVALLTFLQGSSDAQLIKFTYAISGNNLNLTAASPGTAGNALTIATTVSGTSITAMSGGVNPSGAPQFQPVPATFTIDLTASGLANGLSLDTGALAATKWYHLWLIANGTQFSVLASLSATGPILPAGYTAAYRVGAMQTDGSSNLLRTKQDGREARYIPSASVAFPTFAFSTPVTVRGVFTPLTAVSILLALAGAGGGSGTIAVGSNANANAIVVDTGRQNTGSFLVGPTTNMWFETDALNFANLGALSGGATLRVFGWNDRINAC